MQIGSGWTLNLSLCTGIIGVVFCFSCDEFVDVDPPTTQISRITLFEDDASAMSTLSGIYSDMMNSTGFASGNTGSVTLLSGASADDFVNYAEALEPFSSNSIVSSNPTLTNSLWGSCYKYIWYANSILEGLTTTESLKEETRFQLEGEAKFIRAFCYFYLVNLFGDVPLLTSTDYRINRMASRMPVERVYELITSDLERAEHLLPDDFSLSNEERVRPNQWAATALLARVYLYMNRWKPAAMKASALIDATFLFALEINPEDVFLKNSRETIWQLMPVVPGLNTYEGRNFIISVTPQYITLSQGLLDSFETNDLRKTIWIDSLVSGEDVFYYPAKYKIPSGSILTEYSMVLRLAEQYLIRAEARLHQGDLSGAIQDLNVIRNRSNLPGIEAVTAEELGMAIEQERRVEFFSEWGHRWMDLARTDRSDAVLGVVKMDWQSTDVLYPIPFSELENNPNLKQNKGY